MPKTSAGILPYRNRQGKFQVLLIHPGGPFWAKKNLGAWSIAKGEYSEDEMPFDAALREFEEETGCMPSGAFMALRPIKQPSGKVISVWASEMDWDPSRLVSNTFTMEWPKGSGKLQAFPEADRAEWFDIEDAMRRIQPGQRGFLEELIQRVVA